MKKKVLQILLTFCCVFLPIGFFISSCGQSKSQSNGKVQISAENVSYSGSRSIRYNGEEIELDLTKLIILDANNQSVDKGYFTFKYSNNVNAGEAILTITCTQNNPLLKGSFDYFFSIYKSNLSVETLQEAKVALSSGNFSYVELSKSITIGENEKLEILDGCGIRLKDGAVLTNYGTILNSDNIIISKSSAFINAGVLINNGSINVQNGGKFFAGNYDGSGDISNYGRVFCDGQKVAGLIDEINQINPNLKGESFVRVGLASADVELEGLVDGAIEYPDNAIEVAPNIKVDSLPFIENVDGSIVFSNNKKLSENALVKIVASLESEKYFGERELTFRIIKGRAVIFSYEEFLQKQATNLFNRYVGELNASIIVPNGDSIALEQGSVLSLSSLVVLGQVSNCGFIEISNNLKIENSLTNMGEIKAQNLECTLDSSLINCKNATIEVENTFVLSGVLSNDGNIKLSGLQFNNYGLNSGAKIINSGFIDISGDSFFKKLVLTNSGKISNSGKLTITSEYQSFTNTGEFINNGFIYAISGNELIGVENVYYRKCLTVDLQEYNSNQEKFAFVSLNKTMFLYNQKNQIPKVIIKYVQNSSEKFLTLYPAIDEIDFNSINIFDNPNLEGECLREFCIKVNYLEKYADDAFFASAGKLKLSLNLDCYNANFAFSEDQNSSGISFEYFIQRSEKTISNAQELEKLLTDGKEELNQGNYCLLNLNNNIELTNSKNLTLKIAKHCALNLNNHSLYLKNTNTGSKAYFLNEGKILGTNNSILKLKSSKNDAKTMLVNSGEIKDVDKILIEAPKCSLTNNKVNGIVKVENLNNVEIYAYGGEYYGNIFLGFNSVLNGVGENVDVYIRTSLDELREDNQLILESYSFAYEKGIYKKPNIYLNGELIGENFSAPIYKDNLNAGSASVKICIDDEFDRLYFGETVFNFTIEKIEICVDNLTQELIDSQNYSKITLNQNIMLQENLYLGNYGLILDLGIYDFILPNGEDYSIDCRDDCSVFVSVNSAERWYKYGSVADKMTLVCDIERDLDNPRGVIALCHDYGENAQSGEPNKIFLAHYYSLTIDLNGYSFGNDTVFKFKAQSEMQEISLNILSAEKMGSIGCASSDSFAIELENSQSANGIIKVKLLNLIVFNFMAYYNPNVKVNIIASGTVFDSSENNFYAFKLHSDIPNSQGIQMQTSLITYNFLQVNIENISDVVNGLSIPSGIYIGSSNTKR